MAARKKTVDSWYGGDHRPNRHQRYFPSTSTNIPPPGGIPTRNFESLKRMSTWAINQLQNAPQSHKGMSRVIRKIQRAFNGILQVVVKHFSDKIDVWLGVDKHHGHVTINRSDEYGLVLSSVRGYGARIGKPIIM